MSTEKQNAYQILGVPETASPDEIRAAYEKLMERYSEANYLGSPLWDMAEEKRRSLEAAYRQLCGTEAPFADDADPVQPDETEPVQPDEADSDRSASVNIRVRSLLNLGNLEDALSLLNAQPDRDSNPEWIYLRGIAAWKQGWLDEANRLIRRATELVPTNLEYKTGLEKLYTSPVPLSDRDKKERSWKCCKDNWFEFCGICGAECLCEALCEGICGGCG